MPVKVRTFGKIYMWRKSARGCVVTRLCAASQHLPHIHRNWFISLPSVCVCVFGVLVVVVQPMCTFFFVGKLMCVSSPCLFVCVCNQVCLCTTVFCVIPELLLSLTWDYYSVSDLLLPFISIFSPCFIIFFYLAIFLMNTYMISPLCSPPTPLCFVLALLLFLLHI